MTRTARPVSRRLTTGPAPRRLRGTARPAFTTGETAPTGLFRWKEQDRVFLWLAAGSFLLSAHGALFAMLLR